VVLAAAVMGEAVDFEEVEEGGEGGVGGMAGGRSEVVLRDKVNVDDSDCSFKLKFLLPFELCVVNCIF